MRFRFGKAGEGGTCMWRGGKSLWRGFKFCKGVDCKYGKGKVQSGKAPTAKVKVGFN